MVPQRIPDHVERGLALLLSQYRERPILQAWASSYLTEVQALEDAAYGVILSRYVDRATGAALDIIGRLVGQPRLGRADDVYRVLITARIRVTRSFGTLADMYAVAAILAPEAVRKIGFLFVAGLSAEILGTPLIDPALVFDLLSATRAGGVRLSLVVGTAPAASAALWGDDGCEIVPSAQGFGDENDPTTGGRLAADYY